MNWAELADTKWSCGQAAEEPEEPEEEPGPSAPVDAGGRSEEEEEGEVVFPGADFLSITDITQVALLSWYGSSSSSCCSSQRTRRSIIRVSV